MNIHGISWPGCFGFMRHGACGKAGIKLSLHCTSPCPLKETVPIFLNKLPLSSTLLPQFQIPLSSPSEADDIAYYLGEKRQISGSEFSHLILSLLISLASSPTIPSSLPSQWKGIPVSRHVSRVSLESSPILKGLHQFFFHS